MEIGGLMAETFRLFLGNPDVLFTQITWLVFATLILTILEMKKETEI